MTETSHCYYLIRLGLQTKQELQSLLLLNSSRRNKMSDGSKKEMRVGSKADILFPVRSLASGYNGLDVRARQITCNFAVVV